MNTRQALESALHQAMRNKDVTAITAIRLVISAVKLSEVEKGQALDDAAIINLIQKEIKSHRESIADAQKANRPDLIEKEQNEIAILEKFLPDQLSGEEIEQMARAAISESGASQPGDMGKVMKVLMPKIQGKAPGDQVSQVVKKLLTG
jgi:hypothetical protein